MTIVRISQLISVLIPTLEPSCRHNISWKNIECLSVNYVFYAFISGAVSFAALIL